MPAIPSLKRRCQYWMRPGFLGQRGEEKDSTSLLDGMVVVVDRLDYGL
jgi:hypothetical protein